MELLNSKTYFINYFLLCFKLITEKKNNSCMKEMYLEINAATLLHHNYFLFQFS